MIHNKCLLWFSAFKIMHFFTTTSIQLLNYEAPIYAPPCIFCHFISLSAAILYKTHLTF